MKCLVTGGAGFIGSHVVDLLLENGCEVVVLDDLSNGLVENMKGEVKFIEGDIRNLDLVKEAASGVEMIFHLAAVGSVPRSIKEPLLFNEVNVNGTLNILEAARACNVRRVVFSSSSSVYGMIEAEKQVETLPTSPISPYGLTKKIGEEYMKMWSRAYGLETVCLRYFNVFGSRQRPDSQYAAVIPKFISAMQGGKSPVIYGDGEQSRDFTYVRNVAEANWAAAVADRRAVGRVFNVANGENTTVNELAEILREATTSSLKPVYAKARTGDIRKSFADVSLAKKFLNWEPRLSFQEGIEQAAAWYSRQVVKEHQQI